MNKYWLFVFILIPTLLIGQSSFVPLGTRTYEYLDRLEIKSPELSNHLLLGIKPITRASAIRFVNYADSVGGDFTDVDEQLLDYLYIDNPEWSDNGKVYSDNKFIGNLYQHPGYMVSVHKEDFELLVNPVLYGGAYQNFDPSDFFYQTTGGIEIRGRIDDRIGFYSYLADNIRQFPEYIDERIERFDAIPGANRYKLFTGDVFEGWNYFTARGYVTFQATKHVMLQLGHDKNFYGNGYRSLFLSDHGGDYLFFKIHTKIWKLHYQNLFAELKPQILTVGDQLLPKKYATIHHLSMNVTPWLNVGLMEAVIFSRRNQYEFQYLNPIIFYRSIEANNGSPDNVMIGLDLKANLMQRLQLYGQVVIDEFSIGELTGGNGWWGNKYGLQGGLKYIDAFGMENLDVQIEHNTVRPYTYSHNDGTANFTHYNQPLAHPLGSNFRETIGIVRYQPLPRLHLDAKLIHSTFGADTSGFNFGGNIFLDNTDRVNDFENETGQGLENTLNQIDVKASYMARHNIYVDLNITLGELTNDLMAEPQKRNYAGVSVRVNFPDTDYDY